MRKFYMFAAVISLFLFISGPAVSLAKPISYVSSEWIPMSQMDGKGKGRGLFVDIARQIFEKELGIPLVYVQRPWKRAQLEVKNGVNDFMITVVTPERKTYARPSARAFYSLPLYIYTYAGHEKLEAIHKIRTAADIRKLDLIPVTNLGNGWHRDNIDAKGIHTRYVGKEVNILLFLANKRADIMIDAVVPTNYLINKNRLNQDIVLTKSRFSQVDFHLLLSRKSEFSGWMDRINDAFERLEKSGQIQAIVSRYEILEE